MLEQKKYINLFTLLLSALPLGLVAGTFVSELIILLFIILFLFYSFSKNSFDYVKSFDLKAFFFLWIYLIFNSFIDFNSESLIRNITTIRFFILVIGIKFLINNKLIKIKQIFITWLLLISFVAIDILVESILGHNLIGISSNMNGRIASFFGRELKVGGFLVGFALISTSFFFEKKSFFNKNYVFALITIFLIIIFLTGERSNFIKFFIMFFFIFIFIYQKKIKIIIISSFVFFLVILGLYNLSNNLSILSLSNKDEKRNNFKNLLDRYSYDNFFLEKGLNEKYIKSEYGQKYIISKIIFYDHLFIGVGNKNYRKICPQYSEIFSNISKISCSTHPHQIYYELLVEHGILGTVLIMSLLFMIIKKNKGFQPLFIKRAALLYIVIIFIPILPSGSFFTSFGATIFWLNFGFLIANYKSKDLYLRH
jgi:hypothetical protein